MTPIFRPIERERKVCLILAIASFYSYPPEVLPWIQNQAPQSPHRNYHEIGLASLDIGLVSAADMHYRELKGRKADHARSIATVHQGLADDGMPARPVQVVERESWMDAQSVERERLRDEYEKQSHGIHGKSAYLPMREVEKPKDQASLDGQSHIGSSIRGKHDDNNRNGKPGKAKRKDKDKHHKHHYKHHGQHPPSSSVDQQAAGEQTGKTKSAMQKEERLSVNGVRDSSSPPTQPQSTVHQPGPVEGLPGPGTQPSLPSDIPWYVGQVPAHPSGMRSGMLLPGFPWGQQARQGQETLPRNPDFYHGSAALSALPRPPIDQSFAALTEPAFAGTAQPKQGSSQPPPLESSPRTVPPGVSLPFPVQGMPVADGPQNWAAPVYGFPEGIPAQPWQAPPPSTSHVFVSELIGSSDTHGLGLSDAQSMSGKKPKGAMPRAEPVEADEADLAIQDVEDGAGTLEALRARMKKNAEESRLALEREKQARKVSEQRLAALEQLIGTDSRKHVSRFGSHRLSRSLRQ